MCSRRLLLIGLSTTTLALSIFAGCSSDSEQTPETVRQPRQVAALTTDLTNVVEGNTAFAWSMYEQLHGQSGNLFFSPFSISAALGMTYAGAAGNTADQMAQTLHIADPSTFHASFGSLIRDLDGDKGRGYGLFIANRLFGQDGFTFESPFLDVTSQHYGAELELLDFASNPESSRQRINGWVAEKTRDKIPELLAPGIIDSLTRLVLANAIYFKADWAERFEEGDTQDRPFTLRDGTQIQVPTMSKEQKCHSYFSTDMTAAELDYQDNEVAMFIAIPSGDNTIEELEATLIRDGIEEITSNMDGGEHLVQLPKFEFRNKNDLREPLEQLGMTDAFEVGKADLSNMAPGEAGEALYLQAVVHEAYVKVDEQGTEAAAATAVVTGEASRRPDGHHRGPPLHLCHSRQAHRKHSVLGTSRRSPRILTREAAGRRCSGRLPLDALALCGHPTRRVTMNRFSYAPICTQAQAIIARHSTLRPRPARRSNT